MATLKLRPHFSSSLLYVSFFVLTTGVPSGVSQTVDQRGPQEKFLPSTEVSLGIFGQLTPARTPVTSIQSQFGVSTSQRTQGTSPSAGLLGTFHQSFRPWLGYNVNLGYTRFSENYSQGFAAAPSPGATFLPVSSFYQGSIETNMYELTIAYVFEGPRYRRFNTFGQFGGGGLFFLPTQSNSPANQQIRPAMLFGVGINYEFTNHFDIRAEYRGMFYKSPDFAYSAPNFPMSRLFTVTNTPSLSLVYRFGNPKKPHH